MPLLIQPHTNLASPVFGAGKIMVEIAGPEGLTNGFARLLKTIGRCPPVPFAGIPCSMLNSL